MTINPTLANQQRLDFTQNDKIQVSEVAGKKTVTISCSKAIRDVLANKEIKEKTFPFPAITSGSGKGLNMMICPFSQHTALRAPFEKTFTRSEVKKQAPLILNKLLCEFKNFVFNPQNVGIEVIDSILQNLTTNLSQEDENSSKHLIEEPSETFVGATMQTVLQLLQKHPDESEKIQNEWHGFLKNLPLNNQFTLFEKFQTFVLGGELNDIQYSPSKYIDAFVKETLRLYPPLARMERHPIDGASFDLHGIAIRPGDVVFLELRKSQINSCVEKQNEFFPERFFNDPPLTEKLPRNLLCYSSGAKQCLGQHLANIELLLLTGLSGIFSPIDRQKAHSIPPISYQEDNPLISTILESDTLQQTISNPLPKFLASCSLEYAQNFLENPDLSTPEEVELFAKLIDLGSYCLSDQFNPALKLFGIENLQQLDVKVLKMVVTFTYELQDLITQETSLSMLLEELKEFTREFEKTHPQEPFQRIFYAWKDSKTEEKTGLVDLCKQFLASQK